MTLTSTPSATNLARVRQQYLRDAKNIQAYCTCNTLRSTYSWKCPKKEALLHFATGLPNRGRDHKLYTHLSMLQTDMHLTKYCSKFWIFERKCLYKTQPSLGGYWRGCCKENSAITVMQRFVPFQFVNTSPITPWACTGAAVLSVARKKVEKKLATNE